MHIIKNSLVFHPNTCLTLDLCNTWMRIHTILKFHPNICLTSTLARQQAWSGPKARTERWEIRFSLTFLFCQQAQNGHQAVSSSTDYLNKRSKDFMVKRKINVYPANIFLLLGEEQSLGSRGAFSEAWWVCRGKSRGKHVPQVLKRKHPFLSPKLTFSLQHGQPQCEQWGCWQQGWLRKQRPSKRQLEGEEGVDLRSEGGVYALDCISCDIGWFCFQGSGIRVGGNLVEPSAKPCMPFGSGAGGGGVVRRRQVNKRKKRPCNLCQLSSLL